MRSKARRGKRTESNNAVAVDRSLIEWMLDLTPSERLAVLEQNRRMILALRRDHARR
jgi:hypothetical protein